MKLCRGCGEQIDPLSFGNSGTYFRATYCNMSCFRQHKRTSRVEVGPDGTAKLIFKDGRSALISPEDAEMVAARQWHIDGLGYVGGNVAGRPRRLHQLIAGTPRGLHTDHINRDTLDNRRENLRVVTASVNLRNMTPRADGLGGIRGVHKQYRRWAARIWIGGRAGRSMSLGSFASLEEAIAARRQAEAELWGSER